MLQRPLCWPTVVPRKGDVDRNPTENYIEHRPYKVVPRKGDVDRNVLNTDFLQRTFSVVPRKGDVDRNRTFRDGAWNGGCRPPQGGRG